MRRYVWPMLLLSAFGATAQPTYVISTFAGGPDPPEDGAAATQVVTIGPMTVAVDSERNFYFSSGVFLDRILKVSPNGISLVAFSALCQKYRAVTVEIRQSLLLFLRCECEFVAT